MPSVVQCPPASMLWLPWLSKTSLSRTSNPSLKRSCHGFPWGWVCLEKYLFHFCFTKWGLDSDLAYGSASQEKDYIGAILGGDEISCVGFTQNGGQAISSEHKETKKPSCLIFKWERCTASVFNIDLQYYKAKCLRLKHMLLFFHLSKMRSIGNNFVTNLLNWVIREQ